MSEIEAGALLFRALVVMEPQKSIVNDEPTVCVSVRYRGKKVFLIEIDCRNRYFNDLLSLRTGDEMYVSYDGEDISNIKHNPWWKKLWLRLIW